MDLNKADSGMAQPSLVDLFREYLARQSSRAGGGAIIADAQGAVIPHEAEQFLMLDPKHAWDEAMAAGQYLVKGWSGSSHPIPNNWATLTTQHEPIAAVSFAFGNYPQLVRDIHALTESKQLSRLRCSSLPAIVLAPSAPLPERGDRGEGGDFPAPLVAAGILRSARHFDEAGQLLDQFRPKLPRRWQTAWSNEQAALEWHRGGEERAIELWKAQPPNPVIHFNLGMAALFHDRPAEAHKTLAEAANSLPEDSGWFHLARLYITLAETRM
jgi:hypothetical protein